MHKDRVRVRRVGLTGGIGAGKSSVAQMLRERGALVIDADQIAREIVEPGEPALAELVEAFGSGILHDDGTLHRARLASMAFGDADRTRQLNAIMHPRIAQESQRRLDEAADAPLVVYDMPLLVETGQQDLVDVVVVVDIPVDLQVSRAVGQRGLDEADVMRRIAAQATRERRLACADHVIDNSGTPDATRAQVERLWHDLVEGPAADAGRSAM